MLCYHHNLVLVFNKKKNHNLVSSNLLLTQSIPLNFILYDICSWLNLILATWLCINVGMVKDGSEIRMTRVHDGAHWSQWVWFSFFFLRIGYGLVIS